MPKKFELPILVNRMFDENLSAYVLDTLMFYEKFYGKDGFYSKELKAAELEPEIRFFINSPGGYVYDLVAIIDYLPTISIPFQTYCLGMAASCAAVLFASAPKGSRFIGKNSNILLHQVSAGAFGQIDDLKIAAKHAEDLNNMLVRVIADATGKSEDKVREDLDRDLYLNAQAAITYGIADKMIEASAPEIKSISFLKTKDGQPTFSAGQDIETKRASGQVQHKDVKLEIKGMREDDSHFYFSGYAATFGNADSHDDIIQRGAFSRTLKELTLLDGPTERTVLWQHDESQPIGKATLREDEIGLFFEAALPKSDTFCSGRAIPQIKNGSIKTMSFGYRVMDRYYKDNKQHLTDLELYEISPVTIPSNTKSRIKSDGAKSPALKEIETITDVSKYLKSKGLTKSETDDVLFHLKKILNSETPCNEDVLEDSACNEQVTKMISDLKALNKKLQGEKS